MTLQQLTIDTLDRIARGDATADTMIALCHGVERLIPGSTAGVCVLDRAAMVFERAYFPSLAPTFQDAIKGARRHRPSRLLRGRDLRRQAHQHRRHRQ